MINEKMTALGKKRSVIREIFEYAKTRSVEIGAENVFDFSIGNPSVPAPKEVDEAILRIVKEMPSVALHGYTSAQGDKGVRDKIAANLRTRFGAEISGDDLYMTCGAAASLTISLRALCNEGDEVVLIAPFFAEYNVFVQGVGAKAKVVPSCPSTLLPDMVAFAAAISPKTKAVVINSPNNPSGVVYDEETICALAKIMREKGAEFGTQIFLICDEPYRELIYDKKTVVPFAPNYYADTLVCYSYSKSLSLPGERIGYIAVSPKMSNHLEVYAAVCGAGRTLGYVCAPALFQRVAAECDGLTADLSVYKRNRGLLYEGLTKAGFSCVYPDGAFYLFVKSPEEDAYAFYERAKKYELLLVPADDFGVKGFVRVAYCVGTDRIERALPLFEKLAKEYGL